MLVYSLKRLPTRRILHSLILLYSRLNTTSTQHSAHTLLFQRRRRVKPRDRSVDGFVDFGVHSGNASTATSVTATRADHPRSQPDGQLAVDTRGEDAVGSLVARRRQRHHPAATPCLERRSSVG